MNKEYKIIEEENTNDLLCEPIIAYRKQTIPWFRELQLFSSTKTKTQTNDIKVVELFAGVGGFRIGLERASKRYNTIWNNQWEPSTKRQDASNIYCQRFGMEGHSNEDIAKVPTSEIPECDLLVGGFPCQDYSVATTLKNAGGIEGKKGVLWWQIYRILSEYKNKPDYLFFENVDRLIKSPAKQRGRDFAIILASLSDLGYAVEWRVINAAEYGMPQRRRRTYILGYKRGSAIYKRIADCRQWVSSDGVFAKAFPVETDENDNSNVFDIKGSLVEVSDNFNKDAKLSPFENAGLMLERKVTTIQTQPLYTEPTISLGDILLDEEQVPDEFFIPNEELNKWEYLKGSKSEKRINKTTGFEYNYSEGSMAFPDYTDRPSRTIITGEGGHAPSRFKHVVKTKSGRYRRLTPIELERLNMFPDNHTEGASDMRRAFLMGNALVTGVIERVGVALIDLAERQPSLRTRSRG